MEDEWSSRLTQLVPAERQTGGVLIQVLIEIDAQVAQLLLDAFDLLEEERPQGLKPDLGSDVKPEAELKDVSADLLRLSGQVETVPLAQFDQSLHVTLGLCTHALSVHLLLQRQRHS